MIRGMWVTHGMMRVMCQAIKREISESGGGGGGGDNRWRKNKRVRNKERKKERNGGRKKRKRKKERKRKVGELLPQISGVSEVGTCWTKR